MSNKKLVKKAYYEKNKTGVKHHVDHVYPLKHKLFSGLNVPWNLGVVPAVVNLRKHNNVSPEMLRTSW